LGHGGMCRSFPAAIAGGDLHPACADICTHRRESNP